MKTIIPDDLIQRKIYEIRGHRVMLDKDLAVLYHVTTGNLNKAVHRNKARFPEDFMFQLTQMEFENLIFQIGTSSWGGTRKLPYAFTEEGVAMLSGVLKSMQAIQVHVQIIRIFARKDPEHTDTIIQNWMRTRNSIELLGFWEILHNPNFKPLEFEGLRKKAGLFANDILSLWSEFRK